MNDKIAVTSFYGFVNITEPTILLSKILAFAKRKLIKGTIILSHEGFNGSISGEERFLVELVALIIDNSKIKQSNVNIKTNYCSKQPFSKIKVKIKPEIISMRSGPLDVENLKGEYIKPADWDEFISQDDVITIDTRNDYEIDEGTFDSALNPNTESFREFPSWLEQNKAALNGKKLAMFCTGGIRCEKSTAIAKQMGFEEVYHLEGGILQYLDDTGNKNAKWQGDCFVFDDRGGVDDELTPTKKEFILDENGQS